MRLRELRQEADLTGRALALATGWHFTRVSKIENGVQGPTDLDIRAWCAACNAGEQVSDLIAQARAVQSMYLEFRRQTRSGMKLLMLTPVPLYERTTNFRIYEHNVIPGLLQTADYAASMLTFWIRFLETHNDLDESVAARLEQQTVLYTAGKRFSIVLEEAALRVCIGDPSVMAAQLDRLLSVMTLPNVSLGIVPMLASRDAIGSIGFWILDDTLVALETPTASIEVTQPQEIALYSRMFEHLRRAAVYGREVRALIIRALDDLG